MPEQFTHEETKILSPFFTNMDKNVFVLRNLPEVVKGAMFSRYSRSTKSLRRTLLEEFIQVPEMGFKDLVSVNQATVGQDIVATRKAEEFYDRVLVGYGDDSVAELGGAHAAFEEISQLAAKCIEDARIGLSPLEKSTRYVYFDQLVDGDYRFYKEPVLMASEFKELYLKTCRMLFQAYSTFVPLLTEFLQKQNPKPADVSDRAYASTIRAKVCDVIRGLLPASTLTNVGVFGNGRAWEYLLLKMYQDPLAENRMLAEKMHEEMMKVIPSFVKRSNNQYGKPTQEFFKTTRTAIEEIVQKEMKRVPVDKDGLVTLEDYDKDADVKIVTAILYSHTKHGMKQLRAIVEQMPAERRLQIIDEYCQRRQNRRHKPGRAFEHVYYRFDILANFGAYRDLHRHRALTQERQLLTVEHGYDTPQEIIDAGLEEKWHAAMKEAADAFHEIAKLFPKEAQYVVPLAYRIRWYNKINLRSLYHMIELRSTPHGHIDYRRVAQEMFLKIKEVHPHLAKWMTFVDMNEYKLERLESEKKLDKKLEEMKTKYGSVNIPEAHK